MKAVFLPRRDSVLIGIIISFLAPMLSAQVVAGRVIGWGRNISGQVNIPAQATNAVAVAAGANHSLALLTNGTVVAWGLNTSGQASVPADATNVVAIAAARNNSLALRNDGTVVVWGDNTSGQTSVPSNAVNVIAISVGGGGGGVGHCLALKADGTVVAWGNNAYGQAMVPTGLRNVVAISAGWTHSMALRADGSVVVWGASMCDSSSPTPFLADELATISGGKMFSSGLRRDGSPIVWGCWGSDDKLVVSLTFSNLVALAACMDYCVAAKSNGQLVAWARAGFTAPAFPAGISNVITVAAGDGHCLALQGNGACYVTAAPRSREIVGGANATITALVGAQPPVSYQWQLESTDIPAATNYNFTLAHAQWTNSGNYRLIASNSSGTVTSQWANIKVSPTIIQTPSNLVALAGSTATFTVTATGLAPLSYQWKKVRAILPDGGRFLGATTPTLSISDVTATDSGLYRVVVTAADGSRTGCNVFLRVGVRSVAAWGNNIAGQCFVPRWLTNVLQVAGSDQFSSALESGTVTAWGGSGFGSTNSFEPLTYLVALANTKSQVAVLTGEGTVKWWAGGSTNPSVPPPERDIVALVSGVNHFLALRDDGSAFGWAGNNAKREASVPTDLTNLVSLAGGDLHSLALCEDGSVVGWGLSTSGQTNSPPAATNVVAIAAGNNHSLALKGDGSLVAWGQNSTGQANVPLGLSNVVAIASGGQHSAAVTASGQITVWGDNSAGQTNVPAGLSNVLSVASGSKHLLAMVGESAPYITPQPTGLRTVIAMPVLLEVTASGTPPLSYRWQFKGQDLPGATNFSLYLPEVGLADAGQYQVVVSNSLGSVISSPVLLEIGILAEWGYANPMVTLPPPPITNILSIAASTWADSFWP